MNPGSLRHLITIEEPVRVQGPGGELDETWSTVAGFERVWAEVLPDRAGEFFAARQIQATTNAMIRMRYQPGLTAKMRARHEKRPGVVQYWDIAGLVDFQDRQDELRLYCVARESEGYRRGVDLTDDE